MPSLAQVENLKRIAALLEQVRTLLDGKPILNSSGYRSPGVNAAVGGAKDSRHMLGLAADFTCPALAPPMEICLKITASGLIFDQLIYEGTWVHIGLALDGMKARRETLIAHFQNGIATYENLIR